MQRAPSPVSASESSTSLSFPLAGSDLARSSFAFAVFLATVALFASSFHKFGTVLNPLDLAPKNSGALYGIVNTAASVSGLIRAEVAWSSVVYQQRKE